MKAKYFVIMIGIFELYVGFSGRPVVQLGPTEVGATDADEYVLTISGAVQDLCGVALPGPFTDVSEGAWYELAVAWLADAVEVLAGLA